MNFLTILNNAIGFATRIIEKKLFDGNEADRTSHSTVEPSSIPPHCPVQPTVDIERVMKEAVEQIASLAKASTDAIISKIESDKLEELQSRIHNLGFLLRLKKTEDAFLYMLTLKESVDYAQNRVSEGKTEWISACIVGRSAIIAALEYCTLEADKEKEELFKICRQAKYQMLDLLVPQILSKNGKVPWDQVENFLAGASCQPLGIEMFDASKAHIESTHLVPIKADQERLASWGSATLGYWTAQVGEQVKLGDKIGDCFRGGPKDAREQVNAPVSGTIVELLISRGQKIKANQVMGYMQPD